MAGIPGAVAPTLHDDLESMMAKLSLSKEDQDDVVFDKEEIEPEEATRWLVIEKVHTVQPLLVFFCE
jgi:hypothetical protein